MTTEEKLQHFYDVSMESAREEAQKALEEYRRALDDMFEEHKNCLLYTSPSPRDGLLSRMPSSA